MLEEILSLRRRCRTAAPEANIHAICRLRRTDNPHRPSVMNGASVTGFGLSDANPRVGRTVLAKIDLTNTNSNETVCIGYQSSMPGSQTAQDGWHSVSMESDKVHR